MSFRTFLLFALVLVACTGQMGPGNGDADGLDADIETDGQSDAAGDADVDGDSDGDSDGDADGDSDGDSDGDADGDADGDSDADDWVRPDRPDLDSPPPDASWRYGGGVDYPDLIDPAWPIVTRVRNRAQLEDALASASAGDIVYVDDDAEIDLTDASVCIPGGVWLAGGRGRAGAAGGLITTNTTVRDPIIECCGDDIRITGLRILGDEPTECPPEYPGACTGEDRTGGVNCRDCTPQSIGIQCRAFDRLEVDNCELAGWSYAAVWLTDSVDDQVHHNHIHHTQRQGLGYGVVLTRGGDGDVSVMVEHNRFDENRHAIAGSGEPGQDYEARYNLVLHDAIGHVFDMHGENENTDNGSEWAGGEMLIHHNTVLVPDQYALVVRGRPLHGAWLYSNCLARSSSSTAALQRYFFGNFHIDESPTGAASNDYGQSASDCETQRFCSSRSGVGPWEYRATSSYDLDDVALADLDGDGRVDLFRTDGSAWYWSRSAAAGWVRRNTSSYTLDRMAFGDFDGDGADDVFIANGSEWLVSDGGNSGWRSLRAATETLDSLAFGDFDGDGVTDVFTTTGSEWRWSRSGTAAWARRNTSSATLASLAFADFDGDGATDVFSTTGSEWRISRGGSSPWSTINTSSATLGALAFADVDGDGATDVLRWSREQWLVSWSGSSSWQRLRISDHRMNDIIFGDIDGDGADDAIRARCL